MCMHTCYSHVYVFMSRVSMMHRHKRRVGSCASDPAGKLIVSVGWDCAVYVWNAKDGKQVCELKGEK